MKTTLPLGIDIGSESTRVALSEIDAEGRPSLIAVAVRATADHPSHAVAEAAKELGTKERRCIFGIGAPDAMLRSVTFPPMRKNERERAARFEAARFIDYPASEALVRIEARDENLNDYSLGIARKSSIARLHIVAKSAKLSIHAIDDRSLALQRVYSGVDAILDVGASGASLHLYGHRLPRSSRFASGGAAFTEAIATSLGIETRVAEQRKISIGVAGAGDGLRDSFIEAIASEIIDFRAAGAGDVGSMILVGNGSRLANLSDDIQRATAIPTRLGELVPDVSRRLPADVLRAAGPDWSCAVGLTMWTLAG